jgi:hypothetical protein
MHSEDLNIGALRWGNNWDTRYDLGGQVLYHYYLISSTLLFVLKELLSAPRH